MSLLLDARNLNIRFSLHEGEIVAVDDVSFGVARGETVALVGESGSGKSTVAQALLGILPKNGRVASGNLLFSGMKGAAETDPPVDLASLTTDGADIRRIRGGAISMIFQDPMTSLSPLHTVGNQVSEAYRLHGPKDTEADVKKAVLDMLDRVGFPDANRAYDLYPFEMSGGMRQRAMIAMALVSRPALLIADEPTTALDVTVQAQILSLIRDLQREIGMAVLLITHDLGIVSHMADVTVVMYRGNVVESGPTETLFQSPKHDYLKALFKALPRMSGHAGDRLEPLRSVTVDASTLIERSGEDRPEDGPILRVTGLEKTFTSKKGGWFSAEKTRITAVRDVSFEIDRGESLGLVGESGCGKTTVSKMIMCALRPNAGNISYVSGGNEIDLHTLDARALFQMRRRIQYVFQDPASSLNPRMTISNLVEEPLAIHGIGNPAERLARVVTLLKLVGLDESALNRYPHSFSGGQKQRIGIARALALQPEILLCDEPVSALDVSIQAQVLNLLKDLQEQLGLTYLFVSHNLAVVRYLCTRILVMCKGRVVEEGPTARIFSSPEHPYTQALLRAVPDPDGTDAWLSGAGMGVAEGASIPSDWPAPFRLSQSQPGRMVDVAPGHRVLMTQDGAVA